MDVPDTAPPWPSASGPRVPDLDTKLHKTDNLDMNSALAWLRRELAAMQMQDREMYKQLLTMRSNISGLREELKNERERWEIDSQPEERPELKPAPAPGYVTKVEVIRNDQGELKINHVKQDSGILTDEERSDEELEESVQELLKTYPPPIKPRSSSLSFSFNRTLASYAVKRGENGDGKAEQTATRSLVRVRARSVTALEVNRLSTNAVSPRSRSQTVADVTLNRFGSMPVINEIPADALQRYTPRSKTFAIYGYRRAQSAVDNKAAYSVPRELPVAFGSLTRHGSMPVMHSGGRPKSWTGFKKTNENVRLINRNQPIKRSTSQLVLSRPAWEKARDFEADNQMRPHRMYRSTSQVSLV